MKPLLITSSANPKVKDVLHLYEKRHRDATQHFIVEGYREILRALDAKTALIQLFVCEELFLGSNEQALIEKATKQGAQIISCHESVFRKMSYRDRPDGLIAIAHAFEGTLTTIERAIEGVHSPLLVVAEAIEKPGNLGTILRTSDAAGAHGVIVCDRCTDIYNPNVVRASVGTLFTVPVAEASSNETVSWLRSRGIKMVAATPHSPKNYFDVDLKGPIAIIVGAEQVGLSPLWLEQADITVKIPMHGAADSLNVAQATTILLYEAVRQRASTDSL